MTRPNAFAFATLVSACLLPFTTGCDPEKTTLETATFSTLQIKAVERVGSESSQVLKKNLGTQLKAALESGGAENALHVCQQIAQPLTIQTSEALSTATVTRTALRVRNQANSPSEQDRAVLSEWERILATGGKLPTSKIIRAADNRAIYYQPILTEAICLKCHGDPSQFSPELSSAIAQLYPNDKAVNFSEGDLRGAFRVVVELD